MKTPDRLIHWTTRWHMILISVRSQKNSIFYQNVKNTQKESKILKTPVSSRDKTVHLKYYQMCPDKWHIWLPDFDLNLTPIWPQIGFKRSYWTWKWIKKLPICNFPTNLPAQVCFIIITIMVKYPLVSFHLITILKTNESQW